MQVAALAEQGINAWIDADWAASFFELALSSVDMPVALNDVEVRASKRADGWLRCCTPARRWYAVAAIRGWWRS